MQNGKKCSNNRNEGIMYDQGSSISYFNKDDERAKLMMGIQYCI